MSTYDPHTSTLQRGPDSGGKGGHVFSNHRRMRSNEDILRSATCKPQKQRRAGGVYSPEQVASYWDDDDEDSDDNLLCDEVSVLPAYSTITHPAAGGRGTRRPNLSQSQPSTAFAHIRSRAGTPGPMHFVPTVAATVPEESSEDFATGDVAECSICLCGYDENDPDRVPRNLQCGHAYCTSCLERLLVTSSQIDCPTCHNVTRTRSIVSLPKNYPLMSVMRTLDPVRKISQPQPQPQPQCSMPQCPDHDDYLRSYCLKDGTLICSSCELYGDHRGHPTQFLTEAAESERKRLAQLNLAVVERKDKMKAGLAGVEKTRREVQKEGGAMEDEVESVFQRLSDLVEERKRQVKNDIRMRTQLRVNALVGQAKDLQDCITLAEGVNSTAGRLLHMDDYSLLSEVKLILDQIEGVFTNPPRTTPCARNDLKCEFVAGVEEEIAGNLQRCGTIKPDAVTIDSSQINVKSYYDGFRISWEEQNFADNEAISYHLQVARGDRDVMLYRGSSTKYNWKTELEDGVLYKFRVQVRTTEGVGNWSEPKEAKRADPGMHWHNKWRSLKVELSSDCLEAGWLGSASGGHWATFAADKLLKGGTQYYVEIELLSLGKSKSKDKLAVGLIGCQDANPNTMEWQNRKLPVGEWEGLSWSYFPMSEILRSHSILGEGIPYGQNSAVQKGDRIGMLLDLFEKKLSFFCNGNDLGMAFDNLEGESFLLAVSIKDKIKVHLRFPPHPYSKRHVRVIRLKSNGP